MLNCTAHRCGTLISHNQAKCHWIKKSFGVAPGSCPLTKNPFLTRRMATHWIWKSKWRNQTGFMEKWPLSPVWQERTVWLGSLVAARCVVFGLGPSVQLDPATRSFDSPIQSFFFRKKLQSFEFRHAVMLSPNYCANSQSIQLSMYIWCVVDRAS